MRSKTWWWLLPLLLCPVLCMLPIITKPNPTAILAKIPLGSNASELENYLDNFYEESTASPGWDRRESFTGTVNFYHYSWVIPDDLAPSFVVTLTYVKGVLVRKDYGHLPG